MMTPTIIPPLPTSFSPSFLSSSSPYDPSGRIFEGPSVTDNGFWDTFRTGEEDFKHTSIIKNFHKISVDLEQVLGCVGAIDMIILFLYTESFSFSITSVYPMLSLLYPDYLGEIIQGKVKIERK